MKLISIIIPTYNSAPYLPRALESALKQRLPKGYGMEIIVVDDGSTDTTEDVLKPYLAQITYHRLKHTGKPSTTRNAALALAKGELVAFLDADDAWKPGKLALQLPLFDDQKTMLVYSNADVIDAKGKTTGSTVVPASELADGENLKTLLLHNVISTLTVVIRKAAIDEVGMFNESDDLRSTEDYELWLRVLLTYPGSIRSLPDSLALYRQHAQNSRKADSLTSLKRLLTLFDNLWDSPVATAEREELEVAINYMEENWSREQCIVQPEAQPPISVVMSVYNGGVHLAASIESILSQTFSNFEFIIIDDGSSDDSAEIIRTFKDQRIRLVRQNNHGLVYSLNKGVRLARGEFIARQDADDISLPSRFEKELKLITSTEKLGLVGTFFTYIDEKNSKPTITITSPTKPIDLVRGFYIVNPFAHGSVMYRKAAFEQAGGYRDTHGPTEDYDLWRRMAENWLITQLPQSLYWYRLNSEGISHTKQEMQHKYTAEIINEQWKKPFIYKGYRSIVRDAHYYYSLNSPFAIEIFHQYIHQQFLIAMGLFARGKFVRGMITMIATVRLDRRKFGKLVRPAFGGLIRMLKIRKVTV
jgi:glycosyltransferase involved in cell wall biosynthesis